MRNRVDHVSVCAAKLLDFHCNSASRGCALNTSARAALEGSDERQARRQRLRYGYAGAGSGDDGVAAAPPTKPSRPFMSEYFDPKPTVRTDAEPARERAAEPPVRPVRRAPAAAPETVARPSAPA